MQRVLVTGASGFIGRHLVESLRVRDCNVTCLVRPTSDRRRLAELQCQFAEANILSPDEVALAIRTANPDTVFHLAGITKSMRKQTLYDVNQAGSRNVFQACAKLDSPPVVVYASTLAAAGPALSPLEKDAKQETDTPSPVSNYGKSKLAAENEARRHSDRVPTTVIRPPIVFGPHDKDTFEMFQTISVSGFHPVPSWRPMSVSWIQVSDVCEAFIAAAERGERLRPGDADPASPLDSAQASGIYFATSQQVVDYATLGRLVAESIGRRVWPVPTPGPLVWGLASINEAFSLMRGKQNILNFDKAREATAGSWTCSGAKLYKDTGFRCKTSLEETLKTSAAWYRKAGWL